MIDLADPLRLGPATARNRIVFGPHETNLARRRSISDRHVAYYRARAAGGVGTIVVEEATVHPSDWPYERAPLASESAEGWHAVAAACHDEGALVLAALGHAGGQGSSAYHQQALWGPWRTPDVVTREVPKEMEEADFVELRAGLGDAARLAVAAGCDGVELNAGQWSLVRQFLSGLTNHRSDGYGADRSKLLAELLAALRSAVPGAAVGLRLACDELAPWAGIVPAGAVELLASLVARQTGGAVPPFDYVTVVRGSAYATAATRPDGQVEPGFNRAATAAVRHALPPEIAVVAQGSIVEPALARAIVEGGEADAVEMTRAQIADASLAGRLVDHKDAGIRPCVLCNQTCQVRDPRNPVVTCIGEPRSGHETEDPDPEALRRRGRAAGSGAAHLLVVGAGPAGLECARVAATVGLEVTVVEARPKPGGMVTAAARLPGRQRLAQLTAWLERECRRLGVYLLCDHETTLEQLDAHGGPIALCTGSRPGRRTYEVVAPATVLTAADVLGAERRRGDRVAEVSVVSDPIGGPIGVGTAELLAGLGGKVVLVTPDFVAGERLASAGDLPGANARLARAGVEVVKHATVKVVDGSGVVIGDRFSEERRLVPGALLVDAGHRSAEDGLYHSLSPERRASGVVVAGDALAPRTVHKAVLEGRRAALVLAGLVEPQPPHRTETVPA